MTNEPANAMTSPTTGVLRSAPVTCDHCALDVPAGLIERDAKLQFCCHGCRAAYDIIHGNGLERYYRVRQESGGDRTPAKGTGRKFSEFDDPVFAGLYCRPAGGGELRVTELFLEGVHCAACVWLVEKLPMIAPGVLESRLDMRRAIVRITWDPARAALSGVARTLDSLGYPAHPAREASARTLRRAEDRKALVRIGVAGACAGNVMLLALALYAGAFDSMEGQFRGFFRWLSMGITLLSLAWPGRVFFVGAWAAIRTRTVHLDLPIAIGLGAGAIWGVVNTVRGTGEIYFDSLSVLVLALLAGRWVQQRQQRWSSDAVELLYSLTPGRARIVEGDSIREAPIEAISPGMTVEVLAGDSIPVDGVVLSGESSIDQSLLTGESRPVRISPGDDVPAGAVNISGVLRVRVSAAGESTRVGRLMALVAESSRRRAPVVRLADRISGIFVVAMLSLALITAVAWAFIDPSRAIDNAAALLIVTCPCALGLATPLALTVAIGRAARRSVLIKGADAVQSLASPGVIFLDKTGTITHGSARLVRWVGDLSAKPLVAAVEAASSHPVARAAFRALRDELGEAAIPQARGVHETTGAGIAGLIGEHEIIIGSPQFISGRLGAVPSDIAGAALEMAHHALTPVLVGVDGRVVAAFGLGDEVRPDARACVDDLRARGWDVRILSGDHPAIVAGVGRALGLPDTSVHAGVSPEQKLDAVRYAAPGRTVVMVGDGVNDAAALAAATVGIAVHGGAEASLSAADVYINRPGLAPIVELVDASRRTMGVVRRNLAISLVYNISAAALAVTGLINPLIAAILMPASSLSVLTMSFRSRTFPEKRP